MAQGKEFPGSLSHCLIVQNLEFYGQNMQASVLMVGQIFGDNSSLIAKANLGLILYI